MRTKDRWIFVLATALVSSLTCSDDAAAPQVRVTASSLQLSRDTLSLVVGDSAVVWIDARDSHGSPIFPDSVSWVSVNPVVATVIAGHVHAVAAGSTSIEVRSGIGVDTLVVQSLAGIDKTTLSGPADTVVGVGATAEVRAESFAGAEPRAGHFTYTSRDTGVFTVVAPDGLGRRFMKVKAGGSAWIVASEAGGTKDSLRVHARQVAPQFSFGKSNGYVINLGRRLHPRVFTHTSFIDSTEAVAAITSADTTVLAPDTGGTFLAKRVGRTLLSALAASGFAAFTEVFVSADTITTGMPSSHPYRISVGQVVYAGVDLRDNWDAVVGIVSLDPAVFEAIATSERPGRQLRFEGKALGNTKILLSATFMIPDSGYVTVFPPALAWRPSDLVRTVPINTTMDLGLRRVGGDTTWQVEFASDLPAAVQSSDSTVIRVVPASRALILAARESAYHVITLEAKGAGHAEITVTAPGYAAIHAGLDVSAGPKLELTPSGVTTMGARQRTDGAYAEWSKPWSVRTGPHAGTVAVTITHSRPTVAQSAASVSVGPGQTAGVFHVQTDVRGVDTVVASATGFLPDTTILIVTTPHFATDDSVFVMEWKSQSVLVQIADSLGHVFNTRDTLRIRALSSVDSVATADATPGPDSTRIAAMIPPGWKHAGINLIPVDTGTTQFAVSERFGAVAPMTFSVKLVPNTSLRFGVSYDDVFIDPNDQYDLMAVGRFQRTGRGVTAASTDAGASVTITSQDNSILRLGPKSGSWRAFLIGGPTSGTTRLKATAPHHVSAFSIVTEVGAPRLRFSRLPTGAIINHGDFVRVSLKDQRGRLRASNVVVPIHVEAIGGGLTAGDTSIGVGVSESGNIPVQFSRPGRITLVVSDAGSGAAYLSDTIVIEVADAPPRRMRLPVSATIGVGQLFSLAVVRENLLPGDTLNAAVAVRTGRASTPEVLSKSASSITVTGVRPGDDMVIVTPAAGVPGDSARVVVTEGHFNFGVNSDTVKVGQSYTMFLHPADSARTNRLVAAPTTVWLTTTGGIKIVNADSTVVDSVQFIPGHPESPSLRLKGITPGLATYAVSRPGYVPVKRSIIVVP